VSKQILNPPLGKSEALKIIKNGLEMKKLWPLKVGGVKNSKQQTTTSS